MLPVDINSLQSAQSSLMLTNFEFYCEIALMPVGLKPAAHHRLLINKLQDVADGKCNRLMVFMPPGSAKSTYLKLFQSWLMARRPRMGIIGASHTADLAESYSKDVQKFLLDNSYATNVRPLTESAQYWLASNLSHYKAAGVGGPITGRRADGAIIDDPVKSRAEADSQTLRDKTWGWYSADLRTRLKPGAFVVLVMTRWNEDDLGGRLLQTQADLWDVVCLPAQANDSDPLGRAPGEWLWGDDTYDYAADLRKKRAEYERDGAMRDWWALFQQSPRSPEGAIFRTAFMGVATALPEGCALVRYWDLAGTAKKMSSRDPDWTVGILMARSPQNKYFVVDIKRFRDGPEGVLHKIKHTASIDGHSVRIGLPEDPGQASKTQIMFYTAELSGYSVESMRESGDKATRAGPIASQCNVGNLSVFDGAWRYAFIDELNSFPSGSHDDQVDALSGAFSMLVSAPAMVISDKFLRLTQQQMRRRF